MNTVSSHRSRTPLVSVGVPVYNAERYLPHALESLLAQTLSDVEIIVSDNASTDGTEAICAEFARRDDRIRVIRQSTNIGAPRNWSFVVGEARGRYFKWASGNDWCAPRFLERCVHALESAPTAVLAHGHTCLVDEDTGYETIYQGDIAILDDRASDRFRRLVRTLALNNAQSGLIRLDVLRRTGLDRPYPAGDLVLMAELALAGQFVLLPEVLLYRRMGGNTFSRLLKGAAAQEFFNPQSSSSNRHSTLRRHRDYLASICTARISLREKLRALGFAAHHLFWDLSDVWRDMRERTSSVSRV
ncbi:MAG TPA: glycosyltransferase [Burkholderiaceae bacterium]|nr:glycosyltransferase [Burkholderiaceae bacterium]